MTDKQLEANRRNAQLSTGPRTEAGKAVVASNAYKHGLRAQRYLLQDDEPDEFLQLWGQFLAGHQPQTHIEEVYVERLALTQFRLVALEACDWLEETTIRDYHHRLENSFDRALKQLLQIQQQRKAETKQGVNEAEIKKEAKKIVHEALDHTAKLRQIETLIAKPKSPAQEPPAEIEIAYTDPEPAAPDPRPIKTEPRP